MTDLYTYTKFRYEYDKWPLNFKDTDVRLIEPEIKQISDPKEYPYVKRDPNMITLSTISSFSCHSVSYENLCLNMIGEHGSGQC